MLSAYAAVVKVMLFPFVIAYKIDHHTDGRCFTRDVISSPNHSLKYTIKFMADSLQQFMQRGQELHVYRTNHNLQEKEDK